MPRRISVLPVASHTRTPDGDRDHPRNAASTRRNAAALASRPTRIVVPSTSAISIETSVADGDLAGRGGSAAIGSGISWTGRNCTPAAGASAPLRTCRRQFHSSPRLTSCRRATSAKHAPGTSSSATMRSFSSSRQRRRRSTPVMISTVAPVPVLCGVRSAPLGSEHTFRAARRRSPGGYEPRLQHEPLRASGADGGGGSMRRFWQAESARLPATASAQRRGRSKSP